MVEYTWGGAREEEDSVYDDDESVLLNDDEDEVDTKNNELKDDEVGIEEIDSPPNLNTTIEDYIEEPSQLFTITELNDMKNKERILMEDGRTVITTTKSVKRMHLSKSMKYTYLISHAKIS